MACALFPFAPSGAGAAQQDVAKFLAQPAPGSSTEPRGSYFVVAGAPGQVLTQSVALRNDADHPLDLRLAAVDASTAQLGGTAFALETDKAVKAGAWVALDRTAVTLAPKEGVIVPFSVTVPSGAASGVHMAGITMMVPAPAKEAVSGTGQAGAAVTVQSRRVIAVQVNLPGPAEPELVISGVAPVSRPDGIYVELAVENRGGGMTKGEGDVALSADGFAQKFTIDTFLPGTSINYPIKWTDKALDGDHPAHVEIRYGDRVAVWDGKFTVGEAIKNEQANRQVTPPSGTSTSPKSGLPLGPIVGAVVLLGGGIALGRRSGTGPKV
jgi:hypothetical protein